VHWGSEQQEELRYQVTYHTYLPSGGRLLCTPSIELVVGWAIIRTWNFAFLFFFFFLSFIDYVMLTWEKIPGSPRFSVLQWKAGQGLGTRLPHYKTRVKLASECLTDSTCLVLSYCTIPNMVELPLVWLLFIGCFWITLPLRFRIPFKTDYNLSLHQIFSPVWWQVCLLQFSVKSI